MNDEKKFTCFSCALSVSYDYFGKNPSKNKNKIVCLESVFVVRNPFQNEGFLIIGGNCSICEEKVCIDQRCSIFYSKRFCIACAKTQINLFPSPVQKDIQRNFSVSNR